MRRVSPKVFLIGETRVIDEGLDAYLKHVGAPEWTTDAPSDAEKLTEVCGRLCYKSFKPGLNQNVTRVREGNDKYVGNLVEVGHGSVLEHAVVNFVFADVSRVFTHELVRHRVGTAISQESLRYVRLTDLGLWLPTVIASDSAASQMFQEIFEYLEKIQLKLAEMFNLDGDKVPWQVKKLVTSAMRRIAPIGLATSIAWSANHRTIRHVLEMRTAPEAEEEIRLVFGKVGELMLARYPNIYGDFTVEVVEGLSCYRPKHSKI
ncbi:MAG: FAD-dependent thymidylate synthase [Patescibacteria group bacterium]|nr:FAD-dependent thymidylate synthase [Patescibacteria group bacterium]